MNRARRKAYFSHPVIEEEPLRALLKVFAALLLIAAIAAGAYVAWRSFAVTVRVASPAQFAYPPNAWAELAREMTKEGWLRFSRAPVADMAEAAEALTAGKADVAVLRTDLALPPEAKTIAILRRDRIFLIAPPGSPIERFGDLKGLPVGILPGPAGDSALLSAILSFFAVSPGSVARVGVTAMEAGDAIKDSRIAAVLVVGQAGKGEAAEAFASIAKATKGVPKVVGVDDAEALASRIVTLETDEIPEGAFGGAASRPEEETPTLATTWRLVAGPTLSDVTVAELTRQLFEAKGRLVTADPWVAEIQEPDTEHPTFAVHPAAKAYFDGDETTFWDQFENLFWIGSAVIGLIGSAATWLFARLRFRQKEGSDLGFLMALVGDVGGADAPRLAELRAELDRVVTRLLAARAGGKVSDSDLATYQIALTHVRQMIDDRAASLKAVETAATDGADGGFGMVRRFPRRD